MTNSQAQSIISAAENAAIVRYCFINDIPTYFYHDERNIIKLKGDLMVNVRKPMQTADNYRENGVEVLASDLVDIHEARLCADGKKIVSFLDSLGISLDDTDKEKIAQIDHGTVGIIPETGDYVTFYFLPAEEYDKLSPKHKAEYDEMKKFEMKPLVNFYALTEKEYDALNEEDKESYDELLALYKEKQDKYLPPNQAARIY